MENDTQLSFYDAWDFAESAVASKEPDQEGEPRNLPKKDSVKEKKEKKQQSSGRRRKRRTKSKKKKEKSEKGQLEEAEEDADRGLSVTKKAKVEMKEEMSEAGMNDEELEAFFQEMASSSSETEVDEEAELHYYNNYCVSNPASPSQPSAQVTAELEVKIEDNDNEVKNQKQDQSKKEVSDLDEKALDFLTSMVKDALVPPATTTTRTEAAVPIAPAQSLGSKAKAGWPPLPPLPPPDHPPYAPTLPKAMPVGVPVKAMPAGVPVKAMPKMKEMAMSSSPNAANIAAESAVSSSSNAAKGAASSSPNEAKSGASSSSTALPKAHPPVRGKAGPQHEGYYYETWSL